MTVQELPGHADASTTMIHTYVLNHGPGGVRSPADRLLIPSMPAGIGTLAARADMLQGGLDNMTAEKTPAPRVGPLSQSITRLEPPAR